MSTKGARTGAHGPHRWEFKARFRRRAFGWNSRPAIERVREAVSEIKKVARRDPVLAAEGAVLFPSASPGPWNRWTARRAPLAPP